MNKKTANPRHKIDLFYLKKVRFFQGLSDQQIRKIIPLMHVKEFTAEDFIMREGEIGSDIFILLEGEVEISKALVLPQWMESARQREKALIRLSEQSHPIFGEMSMFEKDAVREASIRAIKPSRLASISKIKLIRLLEEEPQMGMTIYRNIASELVNRLRKANKDILKLTTAFSLALEG